MPYSHYLKTYLPQSSFSFQSIWFSVILQKFYLKNLLSLLLWKTCYVEYDHTKTKLISCDRLKTFPRTRCVEYEDYLKEAHDTMEITDVNKNLYNIKMNENSVKLWKLFIERFWSTVNYAEKWLLKFKVDLRPNMIIFEI